MTIILKRRESARLTIRPKREAQPAIAAQPAKEGQPAIPAQPAVEARAGVFFVVRPAGQSDFDLATSAAGRHMAAIAEGKESAARYGLNEPEEGGINDPETLKAMLRVGEAVLAIEMGIRHITAWEGVTEDGKTVAPLDHANIALLLNARDTDADGFSFGRIFLVELQKISTLETSSKNGSSVSLAG